MDELESISSRMSNYELLPFDAESLRAMRYAIYDDELSEGVEEDARRTQTAPSANEKEHGAFDGNFCSRLLVLSRRRSYCPSINCVLITAVLIALAYLPLDNCVCR